MNAFQSIMVFLAVMAVATIVAIYQAFFRIVIVDKYEYLELLNMNWQSGRNIRKIMQQKKRGRIPGPFFYQDMARLEDEELIESSLYAGTHGTTLKQFRKTRKGSRKQFEFETSPVIPPSLLVSTQERN